MICYYYYLMLLLCYCGVLTHSVVCIVPLLLSSCCFATDLYVPAFAFSAWLQMRDGRIAYVDFGNVAQLSQRNKQVSGLFLTFFLYRAADLHACEHQSYFETGDRMPCGKAHLECMQCVPVLWHCVSVRVNEDSLARTGNKT